MPITIELDRGLGPYKGGEIISGKVIVINGSESTKQLSHDLTITFMGKAWTQWKEGRSSRDNAVRQYLVSKWEIETYFNQSFLLLQPGNLTATRSIEPGITELPFLYQLPPNLPSTFHSKHGGVSYTVGVLYRRPWKWDKLVQRDINVQGSYQLTWYPVTSQPGYFTLVKKIWCGLGKIKANLLISKRGFVPGEELHFKLELENDTRLQLKKIRVHLMQMITYFAQSATRQEVRKCHKLKCPQVMPKQSLNYPGCIVIPKDLAPTNLGNCRIVQPRYCLLLKIKTGIFGKTCFYSVLEGRVPISIGTPEAAAAALISSRPLPPSSNINNNAFQVSVAPVPVLDNNFRTSGGNGGTLPNYAASNNNGGSGLTRSTNADNPPRFWNICHYNNRNEYDCDNDPPPTYEDALALPPMEETYCKYQLDNCK